MASVESISSMVSMPTEEERISEIRGLLAELLRRASPLTELPELTFLLKGMDLLPPADLAQAPRTCHAGHRAKEIWIAPTSAAGDE